MKRPGWRRLGINLPSLGWVTGAAFVLVWCVACSPLTEERRGVEAPQPAPAVPGEESEPQDPPEVLQTPAAGGEHSSPTEPAALPTIERGASATPQQAPALAESRLLTLEWPGRMRVGDSDVVRLSLEMDEEGNLTPTVEFAGNELRSEPVLIPNLYETHNIQAEARIEMVGLSYTPQGVTSQSLLPGERVDFFWSIQPEAVGSYRGTVWLSLRFHPKAGGQASQRTVAAQVLEIQAVNLLGMGGTPARLIGAVGTAIGSLLGLDDVLSWLRRRRSARLRD